MFKQKLGAVGFIAGLLGAGFACGGVENMPADANWVQWMTVLGVAATSLMLMQFSVWMIKNEV